MTIELIPCGKLPIPAFPNQGKEHSVGFLLTWEGNLQDTLPNSGRVRVGSNCFLCHSELDSESHSLTDCKGRNNFKTLWICRGLRLEGRSDDDAGLVGDSGSEAGVTMMLDS